MSDLYEHLDQRSNDDNLLGECDEYDESHQYLDDTVVNKRNPNVTQLDEFFANERFRVEPGDPKVNLFEQGVPYRTIHLQEEDVQLAFKLINETRRQNIKGHWTEKQQSGSDGRPPATIMLDIDILQKCQESLLNERQLSRLQHDLKDLFMRLFRPVETTTTDMIIYSDVRRKPSTKWAEKHNAWKDGFQLFIHARLTRDEKRMFVHAILKEKILTKAFGKDYKEPESFLDTNCIHVPTLLYGSCKSDSVPKPLWLVYRWHVEEDGTCIIQKDEQFARLDDRINTTLELSCNFEGKIVKKLTWTARDEYTDLVALMSRKAKSTTDDERQYLVDELNQLLLTDPEAEYIKSVLDCLNPRRYNNHKLKFNVIYALVKNNDRYIPLAKLFLKKSHKYTDEKFNQILTDVRNSTYDMTLENLYAWASRDSPEKFRACNDRSCLKLMTKYAFDSITEGKLGHAHYAEIVWLFLKNKYKTDMRGNKRVWYEFVFPQDPHKKGQVYKWCEIPSPDNLNVYLHRKLSALCEKTNKYIAKKVKKATEEVADLMSRKMDATKAKQDKALYSHILKNFKSSARGLWTDGFKAGILKQAEPVFSVPGFIASLDQGRMDLGVGNGVLVLSWDGNRPQLIKSYNTNKVSRYTSTPYREFDPKDPLIRKILRALRSLHPDTETDAFEYLMSAMAASLDNRPRATLLFMVVGNGANGKSFRFELHAATLEDLYCAQMPIALLLQSKEDSGEAPKPFLMKLETARSAYYEESPVCAVLYMPMVKRVTGCGNLPARNLFQEARAIKSRCYHFVLSNHDFIVMTHEDAVWRRLRRCDQKITFKSAMEFDPENPLHRIADESFNTEFSYEESTRSAYLAILTFFHMKLMRNWGGMIENVPHPTIDRDTLEFRNRQDTLNRFITERIVIQPAQAVPTPLDRVVEMYCEWYDKNVRVTKHFKQDIFKQIHDSALKAIIERDIHGDVLKAGYSVLSDTDPRDGTEMPFVTGRRELKNKKYKYEWPTETPDEYLDRVEIEWSQLLSAEKSTKIDLSKTYDYDSDDPDKEEDDIVYGNDKLQQPLADIDPDDADLVDLPPDNAAASDDIPQNSEIDMEAMAALADYIV